MMNMLCLITLKLSLISLNFTLNFNLSTLDCPKSGPGPDGPRIEILGIKEKMKE